jgi:hypothetical protein
MTVQDFPLPFTAEELDYLSRRAELQFNPGCGSQVQEALVDFRRAAKALEWILRNPPNQMTLPGFDAPAGLV